jgi:hypothetical protein
LRPYRENPSVQKYKSFLKLLDRIFLLSMVHPLAENPQGYVLLLPWMVDGTCSCCRMVWVEYCIPETKLGTSEVGYFTIELFSRVCILKTLKTVVL